MAKYLLLAVVVYLIIRFLRRPAQRPPSPPPPTQDGQAMVKCGHCGVHLPRSEAVEKEGVSYCCDAHRLRGPRVES